jgi:hypothetical protein
MIDVVAVVVMLGLLRLLGVSWESRNMNAACEAVPFDN